MRRTLTALAAIAALAAPATIQAQEGMATSEGMPEGWMMRFDRAGAGADQVDFRMMEPGVHVTTDRAGAAIFWQPGMEADAPFTFRTTMHLFDPASHAEAFGLFVGGENLVGPDQRYLYFLVRQTGEYLIKRRVGSETETVVGWTRHDAIPTMEPGAERSTEYPLAIRVADGQVHFAVSGTVVHRLPAHRLAIDGHVGIRVNHMLDVHVEPLELTRAGM